MFVSLDSNTTGATSEEGTAYPLGPPKFPPVCIALSLVFTVVFCHVNHCLCYCAFSFDHCIVYPSNYGYSPFDFYKTYRKKY